MTSAAETTVRTGSGAQMRHGDHIDTIEDVDAVFRAQRRLSFTYGAVFFAVTLVIPAGSAWWKTWHAVEIWGGFTLNYLVVSLLYYLFLWTFSYSYIKKADALDESLSHTADETAAKTAVSSAEGEWRG